MKNFLVICLIVLSSLAYGQGRELVVTASYPLKDAYADAQDGDKITFATDAVTNLQDSYYITKQVTIDGSSYLAATNRRMTINTYYFTVGGSGVVLIGMEFPYGVRMSGSNIGVYNCKIKGVLGMGACNNVEIGKPGAGNIIMTNSGNSAVFVQSSNFISFRNNTIGFDPENNNQIDQARDGIFIDGQNGSANFTFTDNVIAGFKRYGIHVAQTSTVTISGNIVGTDKDQTIAIVHPDTDPEWRHPNKDAINIFRATGVDIINNTVNSCINGITVMGGSAINVKGNKIGLSTDGKRVFGNSSNGIYVSSDAYQQYESYSGGNIQIGGTAPGEGNTIVACGGNGIFINSFDFTGNSPLRVYNNTIGKSFAPGLSDEACSIALDGICVRNVKILDSGVEQVSLIGGAGANEKNIITNVKQNGISIKGDPKLDYSWTGYQSSAVARLNFVRANTFQNLGSTFVPISIDFSSGAMNNDKIDAPVITGGHYDPATKKAVITGTSSGNKDAIDIYLLNEATNTYVYVPTVQSTGTGGDNTWICETPFPSTVFNFTGPYKLYATGSSTIDRNNLTGTYKGLVSKGNTSMFSDVKVIPIDVIECDMTMLPSSVCINDKDITIPPANNVTVSGPGITGNSTQGYIFSPSGAGAGIHTITFSCGGTAEVEVKDVPVISTTVHNRSCFVADGSVDFYATSESSFDIYFNDVLLGRKTSGSGAGTSQGNLTNGNYTFKVDANGCVASKTVTVGFVLPDIINIKNANTPSARACPDSVSVNLNGDDRGAFTATYSGANPSNAPFTYYVTHPVPPAKRRRFGSFGWFEFPDISWFLSMFVPLSCPDAQLGCPGTFNTPVTLPKVGINTYTINVAAGECPAVTAQLRVEALDFSAVMSTKMTYAAPFTSHSDPAFIARDNGYTASFPEDPCSDVTLDIDPGIYYRNLYATPGQVSYKLFKWNGSKYVHENSYNSSTGGFQFKKPSAQNVYGQYQIVPTVDGYGCGTPITFSIIKECELSVNMDVTHILCAPTETGAPICAGNIPACPYTKGRVKINASGGCVSDDLVYRLYDADQSLMETSVSGYDEFGDLTAGNYFIDVYSKDYPWSCKKYPFTILNYNQKSNVPEYSGLRNDQPREVDEHKVEGGVARTNSTVEVRASIAKPVTAQDYLPTCDRPAVAVVYGDYYPYSFVWEEAKKVKTRVYEATKKKYVDQEAVTSWVSVYTDLAKSAGGVEDQMTKTWSVFQPGEPGDYRVTITDVCGKFVKQQTFRVEKPKHHYKVCYKWADGTDVPFPEPPKETPVTIMPTMQEFSDKITISMEDNMAKCAALKVKMGAAITFNCTDPTSIADKVELSYNDPTGHYTLYYYDRAGRLVRTVPPKGVQSRTPATSRAKVQDYDYATDYSYNSLGQVVSQNTPDGGTAAFIYDNKGQLRFSQNSKQADVSLQENPDGLKRYSYSLYDALGRVTETGESKLAQGVTFSESDLSPDAGTRPDNVKQTIKTVYNSPAPFANYLGKPQRFLEDRVSYTEYTDAEGRVGNTVYSYDPHGNVEWLVHNIPGIGLHTIAYEYNQISDKVLKVKYNEGRADQFYHRYQYDEDNRLLAVQTSKDGLLWEQDASYEYYDHGPLSRLSIGHDNLQQLQYTYTINGWLKGVTNGKLISSQNTDASDFATLQFSYVLGYYDGDFKKTGSPFNWGTGTTYYTGSKNLYNGNISSMLVNYNNVASGSGLNGLSAQNFTYDRIGRVRTSSFFNYGANGFTSGGYGTSYHYDANGNITSLTRANGSGQVFDNLAYTYKDKTNQLTKVADSGNDAAAAEDISAGQQDGNYGYDKIGNLTADEQEGIKEIRWNLQGKITEVIPEWNTSNQKSWLRFAYDAQGNRVMKEVNRAPYTASGLPQRIPGGDDSNPGVSAEYYLRDAQGNIMAVYEKTHKATTAQDGTTTYKAELRLKERSIYGSSRLGRTYNSVLLSTSEPFLASEIDKVAFDLQINTEKDALNNWLLLAQKKSADGSSVVEPSQLRVFSYNTTTKQYEENDLLKNKAKTISTQTNYTAVAEDAASGTAKAFAVVVPRRQCVTQAGTCVPVLKYNVQVYDAALNMIPALDNVGNAVVVQQGGQPLFVSVPGQSSGYLMLSTSATAKDLLYHQLDMSLDNVMVPGAKGRFVKVNQVVESAAGKAVWGRRMAVAENWAMGKAWVFVQKYIPAVNTTQIGTKEIYRIEVSGNASGIVNVSDPMLIMSLPSLDQNGDGDMEISPAGDKLMVVNYKRYVGPMGGARESEVKVYDISASMELASSAPQSYTLPNPWTVAANTHADFTPDGKEFVMGLNAITARKMQVRWNSPSPVLSDPVAIRNSVWRQRLSADAYPLLLSTNLETGIRRGTNKTLYIGATAWGVTGGFFDKLGTGSLSYNIGAAGLPYAPFRMLEYKAPAEGSYTRTLLAKEYELTDHLGNVRVVVNDIKVPGSTAGTYEVPVVSAMDYYAFGMIMPDRSKQQGDYRYGFNGKEKESQISDGDYDFGDRIYDAKLGRWLSVDFLSSSYVPISPYAFSLNNPVIFKDADGNVVIGSDGKAVTYSVKSGKVVWSANATKDVQRIGNSMLRTGTGTAQFNQMMSSSTKIHLKVSSESKIRVNEKGQKVITYGETVQGNYDEKDNYGKFIKEDGTYGLKEATITIYEGSIKGTNASDEDYGSNNFTTDEVIGIVGSHESVHASDEKEVHEDIKHEQEKGGSSRPKSQKEAKPEMVEGKARKETKALKTKKR